MASDQRNGIRDVSRHDDLCLRLVGKRSGPCICWLLRQARAEATAAGIEATVNAYNAGYSTAEGRWSDAAVSANQSRQVSYPPVTLAP